MTSASMRSRTPVETIARPEDSAHVAHEVDGVVPHDGTPTRHRSGCLLRAGRGLEDRSHTSTLRRICVPGKEIRTPVTRFSG